MRGQGPEEPRVLGGKGRGWGAGRAGRGHFRSGVAWAAPGSARPVPVTCDSAPEPAAKEVASPRVSPRVAVRVT